MTSVIRPVEDQTNTQSISGWLGKHKVTGSILVVGTVLVAATIFVSMFFTFGMTAAICGAVAGGVLFAGGVTLGSIGTNHPRPNSSPRVPEKILTNYEVYYRQFEALKNYCVEAIESAILERKDHCDISLSAEDGTEILTFKTHDGSFKMSSKMIQDVIISIADDYWNIRKLCIGYGESDSGIVININNPNAVPFRMYITHLRNSASDKIYDFMIEKLRAMPKGCALNVAQNIKEIMKTTVNLMVSEEELSYTMKVVSDRLLLNNGLLFIVHQNQWYLQKV
jgi:hypothetical protein